MIYTIGNEKNYREAIAKYGAIQKLGRGIVDGKAYEGGYVFKTQENAERYIDEVGMRGVWIAWGVNAEWGVDTEPVVPASVVTRWQESKAHFLLRDADIVVLEAV
jgi:hypothetical protein